MLVHASKKSPCVQDGQTDQLSCQPLRVDAPRRRRGATSMEYLVMMSFLFVVAMIGINSFGQATKKLTQEASSAIQQATEDTGSTPAANP